MTVENETIDTAVMRRTLCLRLKISTLGVRRKAKVETVINPTSRVDRKALSLSKTIIDTKSFGAITKHQSQFETWLETYAIPDPMLDDGVYRLPLGLVETVEQKVREFIETRQRLVEEFLPVYTAAAAAAQERLQECFNERDYPPAETLRGKFRVTHRYLSYNVPELLEEVNQEIFREHSRMIQRECEEAVQEIRVALRAEMLQLVGHMAERLENDPETGRPKIFKVNSLDKINGFLEVFEHRNLTSDHELQELVTAARRLMSGITPDALRETVNVREAVRNNFNLIRENLEEMVQTAPARRIRRVEEVLEVEA